MVSLEKIFEKFSLLDEYLGLLGKIAKTPIDKFLKDKILIGSAKYYLQVSIECCLDKDVKDLLEFKSIVIGRYGE